MTDFDPTVEYRDVPGFPGYRVGADGSVWSCRKQGGNTPASKRFGAWHRMRPRLYRGGHYGLSLGNGERKLWRHVHTLVLLAFVGPRQTGQVCRHLNGDAADNCVDNLKWGTPAENASDRIAHGRSGKGSQHPSARLCEADVLDIRATVSGGLDRGEAATLFEVSRSTIDRIMTRDTWGHV